MGAPNSQFPEMLRPNYLGMISPGFFTNNPYAQFPGVPLFPQQPTLGSFLTHLNPAPPSVTNVPVNPAPPASTGRLPPSSRPLPGRPPPLPPPFLGHNTR